MDDASCKDEGRTTGARAAGRKGKERETAGRTGKGADSGSDPDSPGLPEAVGLPGPNLEHAVDGLAAADFIRRGPAVALLLSQGERLRGVDEHNGLMAVFLRQQFQLGGERRMNRAEGEDFFQAGYSGNAAFVGPGAAEDGEGSRAEGGIGKNFIKVQRVHLQGRERGAGTGKRDEGRKSRAGT